MSELVCEALATKAELQELRDQINQLILSHELNKRPKGRSLKSRIKNLNFEWMALYWWKVSKSMKLN